LKEGGVLPVTLRNVEPALKTARLTLPGSHRFSEQRLTEDADVIAAMLALEKFEQQSRQVKLVIDGETRESTTPTRPRVFLPRPASRRQPTGATQARAAAASSKSSAFRCRSRAITSSRSKASCSRGALLATPKPMYVRTAALVTNMAVHLKARQGQRAGLGHGAR
jgi:hypothetical protein